MYMKPTAPPSIEDDGEDAKRGLGRGGNAENAAEVRAQ
jgi:hypothetical protein